jgi:hypothetical protein
LFLLLEKSSKWKGDVRNLQNGKAIGENVTMGRREEKSSKWEGERRHLQNGVRYCYSVIAL